MISRRGFLHAAPGAALGFAQARAGVGVFWPPGRAPVQVAVYLTQSPQTGDERNAVIAAAGRAIAAEIM